MKTTMKPVTTRSFWVRFGGVGLVAGLFLAISAGGCSNTADGDRCDPVLSHDECANGPTSVCMVPTNCADAFCCKADGTSTEANCQPCVPGVADYVPPADSGTPPTTTVDSGADSPTTD